MQIDKKTLRYVFLGAIACILLYWVLNETQQVKAVYYVISGIISPFVLGAVLAFIVNVPMRAIEGVLRKVSHQRLRRTIAVILTLLCVLLVLTLVFLLLIPQLIETIQSLIPKLQTFFVSTESAVVSFLNDNPQVMEWLSENTDFEQFDWAGLAQKAISMVGNSLTKIVNGTFSAIGGITGAIMDAFIATVFAVYCLFQKETLARQGRRLLYAFLPEKVSDATVRILRLTNSTFSNFLSGQCLEVCILGVLFAVSMAIFRMPYIPLVSVLVAVTAFIPVVGAWVGCVFGAFLILVANPVQAVWFVVMFVILQQIENNLIYPRVVGTSIGLSGMWVLVAVAVGGELMGVVGMFLMIPVTSVVYTLLRERTNRELENKDIDSEKLTEQPPELRKRVHFFKVRRADKKEKKK